MGLNTTPATWVTNETVTATKLNTEIRDALTGIQSAWTAYTPTWTNWTVGNAVVVARHQRIGKTCHVRADVTGGTTSSGGAGGLQMSLPFAAHASGSQIILGVYAQGASPTGVGMISIAAGASVGVCQYTADAAAMLTNITVLNSGQVFRIQGTYEVA